MSNLVEYRQPESAHWYGENGEPRHNATLREARKENLYPSVTSILAIKEKPQLTNWKIAQMVAQSLTMTRYDGESDWHFIERVKEADAAERAKAPDLGTAVHSAIARYISKADGIPVVPDVDMGPVYKWIDEHVGPGEVEKRFVSPLGFGGCIDYMGTIDGRSAIADWKSQGVKKAAVFYDDFVWQLAAYQRAPRLRLTDLTPDLWSVIIDTAHSGCYVQRWEREDVLRGWDGFRGLYEAWVADRKFDPRVGDDLPF
jgi:hypothetical protein